MTRPTENALVKVDSRRVYALARESLGQLPKDLGFTREKAMLSWTRRQGSKHLTFWFQVSQYGWDPYSGSQFTVGLQLADQPRVGSGMHQQQLPALVGDAGREEIRQLHNELTSRLEPPPSSYLEWLRSAPNYGQELEASYLRQFKPLTQPSPTGTDIWFRYANESDVRAWCEFIREKLPSAFEELVAAAR